MTNLDEVPDKFFDDLDYVISVTTRTDKFINARVGTGHQTWEGVIGSEGIGKCNSNGILLLRKRAEHDLLIANTGFCLPNRNKTWLHLRSKRYHLTDYVVVRRKDKHDVKLTKTMCGADSWTHHRLVVSKINLRIQPARRPQGNKVDISKLKQESKWQAFSSDLCNRLDAVQLFRKAVLSSAVDTLGNPRLVWWKWWRNPVESCRKTTLLTQGTTRW